MPAGRLLLTEEAEQVVASSFAYGLRYLERPGRFSVDPVSLPLDDIERVRGAELMPANGLPLFGGIRDAAPDAWGRRVIEARRKAPANSLPESAYLLEAGSDRVGALDVRDSLEASETQGVNEVHSLGYMLETAERIGTSAARRGGRRSRGYALYEAAGPPQPVKSRVSRPSPGAASPMANQTQQHRENMANAIRALAMDAVQQANSGHPGAPDGHGRHRRRAVGRATSSTTRPTRTGPTATASCCPTATARCCCTRCCT